MEHLVLFFPGQHQGPEEHVAFGRQFGTLEGHANLRNPVSDQNEIFALAATAGAAWRTSGTGPGLEPL